ARHNTAPAWSYRPAAPARQDSTPPASPGAPRGPGAPATTRRSSPGPWRSRPVVTRHGVSAYKSPRALSRSLSQVDVGGHGHEETSKRHPSFLVIGSHTARRDAAPQPGLTRYTV